MVVTMTAARTTTMTVAARATMTTAAASATTYPGAFRRPERRPDRAPAASQQLDPAVRPLEWKIHAAPMTMAFGEATASGMVVAMPFFFIEMGAWVYVLLIFLVIFFADFFPMGDVHNVPTCKITSLYVVALFDWKSPNLCRHLLAGTHSGRMKKNVSVVVTILTYG